MRRIGNSRSGRFSTVFTVILAIYTTGLAAELPQPVPLQPLTSTQPCNHCEGTLLPGRTYQHPESRWGIISDLPESFGSYGVLYTTRDVLPDNGGSEELRHQRKANGFTTIDGGFDVFFFHLTRMSSGSRIAVYVKNRGSDPIAIRPVQVIKSEGIIGTQHEFESALGRRVLARDWDDARASPRASAFPDISFKPALKPDKGSPLNIPAGEGRVIAYGKQFGNVEDGPDASHNVNCFGYVRAYVAQTASPVDLEVSIIAIPAGAREQMQVEAEKLIDVGARSTDQVPMDREQQGCALGRPVGVYRNFFWKNDPLVIDASRLDQGGTTFPMCLPDIQTAGCADARQTTDLVLRPGYTRNDTIGNYMIEYHISARLINPTSQTLSTDFVFGKRDADIGLAYDREPGSKDESFIQVTPSVVSSQWAGPRQTAREKSLARGGKLLTLLPGEQKQLNFRFLVCGNSSLPFYLGFKRVAPQPDAPKK